MPLVLIASLFEPLPVVEIEPVPVIVSVPEFSLHCVVTSAVLIVIVPPLGEGHGAAIDEV